MDGLQSGLTKPTLPFILHNLVRPERVRAFGLDLIQYSTVQEQWSESRLQQQLA